MPSPPDPAPGLRELQAAFGRGLLGDAPNGATVAALVPTADGTGVDASVDECFDVYRNNAWQSFHTALARTYPVVQRRVGEDYFRQLAREFRTLHPSRRGDLHWVGEPFPAWLGARLAGTGYEWLADLARLEWACEEAVACAQLPPVTIGALGAVAPDALTQLTVQFQPSLRTVASAYPVWSVWQANQGDAVEAAPVDLARGEQRCLVACVADRVAVYRLEADGFRLLQRLVAGDGLGDALESAATGPDTLTLLLAWACEEGLVTGFSPSAPA